MSARSRFGQRMEAPIGKHHPGIVGEARRTKPVDPAEIAFVHERRAAVPDLSCHELARLVFRQFGIDRHPSTIRNWLNRASTVTT